MGEDLTIESLQSIEGYTIKEIEDKTSGFNSHTSTKLRIFRKAAEQQRFVAFPFLCKGEHSVNSILNDYSTITEIELNKRISYYEHTDFSTDTIELLVRFAKPRSSGGRAARISFTATASVPARLHSLMIPYR